MGQRAAFAWWTLVGSFENCCNFLPKIDFTEFIPELTIPVEAKVSKLPSLNPRERQEQGLRPWLKVFGIKEQKLLL